MLFSKHGQNGIQAKHIIDAGGRLLVKRVTSKDATLANLVLTAKVTSTVEQKKNSNGDPLYIDEEGNETTEVTDTPATETINKIKWEASSVQNAKKFEEVEAAALDMLDDEAGVYPLFVYTDNGKGVSAKAVRLIPDYYTSKGMGKMFYNLNVYEGTTRIEPQVVAFDPTVTYSNESYAIDRSSCVQIGSKVLHDVYDLYLAKLSSLIGIEETVLRNYDLVYGYDNKGNIISGISLDEESVDLNST